MAPIIGNPLGASALFPAPPASPMSPPSVMSPETIAKIQALHPGWQPDRTTAVMAGGMPPYQRSPAVGAAIAAAHPGFRPDPVVQSMWDPVPAPPSAFKVYKSPPTVKTKIAPTAPPAKTTKKTTATKAAPKGKSGNGKTTTTTTPAAVDPGPGIPSYVPQAPDFSGLMKYLAGINTGTQDYSVAAGSAADADIKAQVANYLLQQKQTQQQGVSMAEAIQAAGNAVANLQKGAPEALAAAYGKAGSEVANIASGFGQGYGAQGAADQQGVNALGAAVGGPQVGPLYNAGNAAQAIGMQQGALPGASLVQQGADLMRSLSPDPTNRNLPGVPGQFIGQGRQDAMLAMGAANQAANAFNPQIANVYAQRPKLVSDYLTSFNQQGSNTVGNQIKIAALMASIANQQGTYGLNTAKLAEGTAKDQQTAWQKAQDANIRANTATINARFARYRAITGRLSQQGSAAKTNLQFSQDLAKSVDAAVNGVMKIGKDGSGNPVLIATKGNQTLPDAYHSLLREYPSIATPQGSKALLDYLRTQYGVPASFTDAQVFSGYAPAGSYSGVNGAQIQIPNIGGNVVAGRYYPITGG